MSNNTPDYNDNLYFATSQSPRNHLATKPQVVDLFGQDSSLEQQIKCVEREIGMRQRVYPNWVNAKKMSAGKAEYEILMMQEVLKTLNQNAKVKQQLAIAVEAIKAVLHDEFILEHADAGLVMYLTQAEYKIKELEK